MCGIARASTSYLGAKGYNDYITYGATFIFCVAYLSILKFPWLYTYIYGIINHMLI